MTSTAISSVYQDWKHPRNARGFTGHQGSKNGQSTVLRCVTNSVIPCSAEAHAAIGKTRFNVTVLTVGIVGRASAPNKRGPGVGGKYLKLVNTKPLFEEIRGEDSIVGVKMYAFRKANSNTDRGEREDDVFATIRVGQVRFGRLVPGNVVRWVLLGGVCSGETTQMKGGGLGE